MLINDGAQSAAQEGNAEQTKAPESTEASWWIDENLPGSGDRPEWLPEKFKTVADMSKSYSELEKRFGSTPKEYDFSKAESWIETESDVLKNIASAAREKGVPQDFMDVVFENIGSHIQSKSVDVDAEIAKLGDNAKERLETLNNWAKSNLSENAFKALTASMSTADAVMAVEELRTMMLDNMTKVPTENESSSGNSDTPESIQKEIVDNYEKYKSDPAYARSMRERLERILPKED